MRTSLSLVALAALACAPPVEQPERIDPNQADYDEAFDFLSDDLRDLANTTAEGALEGTFAMKSISATLVDTGVAGTQRGGGVNFRIVRRSYDEETFEYAQTSELCGGFNFEVAGVETSPPEATYRLVPESTEEVLRAEPERGVLLSAKHLQLWAVRDLPDPFETALPTTAEEAAEAPHVDRIFDMDDDGEPGMTLQVTGLVEGEVYAAQRKRVDFTGVVVDPDLTVGWAFTSYNSVVLGASNPLFEAADPAASDPHPDLDESWFEERRVDDGIDCDGLMAEVDDGLFSQVPLWRQ
jgi:hypothetical protein